MLKKLVCLVLVCIGTISFCLIDAYAYEYDVIRDIVNNLSTEDNYVMITDKYEIYGNHTKINEDDFYEIASLKANKIYLHYSTNRIYNEYDMKIVSNNNGSINSIVYSNKEKIPTLSNFINFLNLYENHLLENKAIRSSSYSSARTTSYNGVFTDSVTSEIYVIDFAPKGYITARIYLKEYNVNFDSSLFIASVISTFVPGAVAKDNNLDGYDNWKNDSGYVHMSISQAYDRTEEEYYGIRYGAIPYYKDYWPVNIPGSVTISSSINTGVVLGMSEKDGFKIEGNFAYGYSKAFTVSNPKVSAQFDNQLSKVMWSYEYEDYVSSSYDQESNILYEVSTSGKDLHYGDIRLQLDYKLVVDKLFHIKKTYTDTLDLILRPNLKKIYKFSYGML